MGNPVHKDTADASSSAALPSSLRSTNLPSSHPAQTSNPSPAAPPTSATHLPPAALQLAAKLFDLARAGSTPELMQYIDAGIPPNLTNHTGDTLLMLSAYHGHVETVRALLRHRADPNTLNDRGQSIIAGAVFKGYDEVVRVLFEGGADKDRGQPSAVECAKMFRRMEVLRLFGEEMGEGIPGITIPRR